MGEAPAMGRESGDAGDEPVGLVAGGLVAHLVLRVAGGDDPLVAELGLERERAGGDADALLVAVEAVRFEEVAPEGVVDGVEVVLVRSEEHTSELQSRENLVCRLLLEKKKKEP